METMQWRLLDCSTELYNIIPMHAEVKLCERNLHSSPCVRNNSHYQQSLLEHTEAEFATGHITTIESGTCKDGKWEEEGRGRKKEEEEGKKERERGRQSMRSSDRNKIKEEVSVG